MAAKKLKTKKIKMKDVLEIYPVCRKTIERWCVREDNPMPHEKINGYYYFDVSNLKVWDETQSNIAS